MSEKYRPTMIEKITRHPPKLTHSGTQTEPFLSNGNKNIRASLIGTHSVPEHYDFNSAPNIDENDTDWFSATHENPAETVGLVADNKVKQVYIKTGNDADDYIVSIPLHSVAVMHELRLFIAKQNDSRYVKEPTTSLKYTTLQKGGANSRNVSRLSAISVKGPLQRLTKKNEVYHQTHFDKGEWAFLLSIPPTFKTVDYKVYDNENGIFNYISYNNRDFKKAIITLTKFLKENTERNNFRIRRYIISSLKRIADLFLDSIVSIVSEKPKGWTDEYKNLYPCYKFLVDPYRENEDFKNYKWVYEVSNRIVMSITNVVDDEEPPFSDSDRKCLRKYLNRKILEIF